MGCYHHAADHTLRPHRNIPAVVEAAHHLAFWTLLELIGWQVQARLDERVIEHAVLFATGYEGEACQIGEHGSRAILSKDMQQGALPWELVCSEIATNGHQSLAQFHTILPVAAVSRSVGKHRRVVPA
jgi:hypothetical protein